MESEISLGADHPTTIAATSHLAATLGDLGNDKSAKQILVKIVETEERVFGSMHVELPNVELPN